MEATGPVGAGQNGESAVQIGARQNRPGNNVSWDPRDLVVGPDVIDGLHQARVVDGKGMSWQQARRIEARKSNAMLRPHPDKKTLAVELSLIVFIMGNDGRRFPTGGNHDGAATGGFGVTLIAATGEIPAAVPQKDIVEVDAGAMGDTLDLA